MPIHGSRQEGSGRTTSDRAKKTKGKEKKARHATLSSLLLVPSFSQGEKAKKRKETKNENKQKTMKKK